MFKTSVKRPKTEQAGRKEHRIKFQQDNGTKDAIGGNAASWVDVPNMTVWASIKPLSGRDIILGAQISPDTTHVCKINYRPGLHSAMRFVWIAYNRIFHLTGPPLETDTAGVELVLMCKEVETVT